jgi:TolB protein
MRALPHAQEVIAVKRSIGPIVVAAAILFAPVVVTGPALAEVPGPNGQILFGRFRPALDDTVLYTVNPDGSHLHRVIPGPVRATECAHWSPDGSVIAACASSPAEVADLIDPDTGDIHGVPDLYPSLKLACPLFSPDSRRLACGQYDAPADPSRVGIYTVRASDGGGIRRVTSNPGTNGKCCLDEPGDYSPNGTQMVFLRTDPTRPRRASEALFVVNVDGTGLHRITPWSAESDAERGNWSPDGSTILFGVRSSLFLVNPDGSDLRKLPLDTSGFSIAYGPSWSPNGSRIVFSFFTETSPGTGRFGIFTAKADGTDLRQVTDSPTNDESADWGPHPLAT